MGRARTTTSRTTTKAAEARERWAKALELRKSGKSYAMIAAELGYSDQKAAYTAVHSALKEIVAAPAEEVRRLELERLDGLWVHAKAHVENCKPEDSVKAIQAAIKIQERRARLLGLDAPVKTQEVAPEKLSNEQLAAELEKALAELRT